MEGLPRLWQGGRREAVAARASRRRGDERRALCAGRRSARRMTRAEAALWQPRCLALWAKGKRRRAATWRRRGGDVAATWRRRGGDERRRGGWRRRAAAWRGRLLAPLGWVCGWVGGWTAASPRGGCPPRRALGRRRALSRSAHPAQVSPPRHPPTHPRLRQTLCPLTLCPQTLTAVAHSPSAHKPSAHTPLAHNPSAT
jgi:hypothetical protein